MLLVDILKYILKHFWYFSDWEKQMRDFTKNVWFTNMTIHNPTYTAQCLILFLCWFAALLTSKYDAPKTFNQVQTNMRPSKLQNMTCQYNKNISGQDHMIMNSSRKQSHWRVSDIIFLNNEHDYHT